MSDSLRSMLEAKVFYRTPPPADPVVSEINEKRRSGEDSPFLRFNESGK